MVNNDFQEWTIKQLLETDNNNSLAINNKDLSNRQMGALKQLLEKAKKLQEKQ